jgi:hypothetical protein
MCTLLPRLVEVKGPRLINWQRAGELDRRDGRYGCSSQPRAVHRAIEAGLVGGDGRERRQQEVFPFVILEIGCNISDKSTVSGGFAVVQPDSTLSINAVRLHDAFCSTSDPIQVEGFPLEDFSAEVSSLVLLIHEI